MDDRFIVGRVGEVWWDEREGWLFNLSIYDTDGERIGRESDPCGGPGGFEPSIPYAQYRRIERPAFPLSRQFSGKPVTMADGRPGTTQEWSYHPSVKTRPDRLPPPRKVAGTVPETVPAPVISDYEPQLEAAARRMAAQTLRDLLRGLESPADKARLRAEIETLEDEAEGHHAEHVRMVDAKIAAWRSDRRRSERLARALRPRERHVGRQSLGRN